VPEDSLAPLVDGIPYELRALDAWAVWRHETDSRGHESKPPYCAFAPAERAYASHPETWASFQQALECYATSDGYWEGVSFAIDERHGIVGVDLDHVREHGAEATQIARALDSYTEWSPSGEGLRIFVLGTLPPGRCIRDWVEMYSNKRFLTVTGHRLPTFPFGLRANQAAIEQIWTDYLEQAAA
jgi:putative DNA primase/helicase